MKNFALVAATALTFAAPAFAQSQLERSFGVPAGVYTQAELSLLAAKASEDGNNARVHFDRDRIATRTAPAQVDNIDRLALSLGVASGQYSPNELAALKSFQDEDGNQRHVYQNTGETPAANAALAASLGVSPLEYTLADLVLLKNAEDNDGNF